MRIALCNEVLAPMEFARQCAYAAELGYQGLELAPFTLADESTGIRAASPGLARPPEGVQESLGAGRGFLVSARQRAAVRRSAADAGIAISGLHWLLRQPAGLSITSEDASVRRATLDVMHRQIELCAELGGAVLVHGSPAQRRLPEGDATAACARAIDAFASVARHAQDCGVTYCIEPLAPPHANFIHTLAEAAAIVRQIGQPALRTMLDCCAAAQAETETIPTLIDQWLPTGLLAHVQVNDSNLRGPGQGDLQFGPILQALTRQGYQGWIAVEPFDYQPDGPGCAAYAIGYLRALLEQQQPPPGARPQAAPHPADRAASPTPAAASVPQHAGASTGPSA